MTETMETAREARAPITRPILFSAAMVRAILDGRKTQTRRIVNPQPDGTWRGSIYDDPVVLMPKHIDGVPWFDVGGIYGLKACPYGTPGDRLWVRESWQAVHFSKDIETGHYDGWHHATAIPKDARDGFWTPVYAADQIWDESREDRGYPWRPSIFMPRWASRITLEITKIRVERLQDISDADSHAEGCATPATAARSHFRNLWESINGPGSWAANPWVWVIGFSPFQSGGEKKR